MTPASDACPAYRETGGSRLLSALLWLALATGWLVSTFSVIQEMCMVSACQDTASFTIFGLNMGWFGIAYFTTILIVLWLRKRRQQCDVVLNAMVFSGIGAEFRLLWIQKFIIGGWCPLCVTICCMVFAAALLLAMEKIREVRCGGKRAGGWVLLVLATSLVGFGIAFIGVKALY